MAPAKKVGVQKLWSLFKDIYTKANSKKKLDENEIQAVCFCFKLSLHLNLNNAFQIDRDALAFMSLYSQQQVLEPHLPGFKVGMYSGKKPTPYMHSVFKHLTTCIRNVQANGFIFRSFSCQVFLFQF